MSFFSFFNAVKLCFTLSEENGSEINVDNFVGLCDASS